MILGEVHYRPEELRLKATRFKCIGVRVIDGNNYKNGELSEAREKGKFNRGVTEREMSIGPSVHAIKINLLKSLSKAETTHAE